MVYRCDIQHFLHFVIDYFSLQDITSMQYAIISGKVKCGSRAINTSTIPALFPNPEIIIHYSDKMNKDIMKKEFMDQLKSKDNTYGEEYMTSNPSINWAYLGIANPLLEHVNTCIICDEDENDYIDVICDWLKDDFHIEVINLNKLFDDGYVGPIHIDRKDIRKAIVDVRRDAVNQMKQTMMSTESGRMSLLSKIDMKDKIDQLKKRGIHPTADDDIDQMLSDIWADEEKEDTGS